MDGPDSTEAWSAPDGDCGQSSGHQSQTHEIYTAEEFNNDIELNDEWQDDDLLSSSAQRISDEKLKFGAHGKQKLLCDRVPAPEDEVEATGMTDDFDHGSGMSASDSPQRTVGVDLEWDNDTPIMSDQSIPTHSTLSEPSVQFEPSTYRTVIIGEEELQMDLSAVIPYKQVLSHGGYYGEGLNAIVVFSACYLPDYNQTDYEYIMDNLFLYIVSTLDLLVAEEYKIVFFNGGCKRRNVPSFTWMKRCYKMIHRRLRKNLKQLLIVHPSLFMRALITFFRPFISSKFSRKLRLVSSLKELSNNVDLASVSIPDAVTAHDARKYRTVRRVIVERRETGNSQASGTLDTAGADGNEH